MFIKNVMTHPKFTYRLDNRKALINDIALIRVIHEIHFNRNIRPVALPMADGPWKDQVVSIAGWGRISVSKTLTTVGFFLSIKESFS